MALSNPKFDANIVRQILAITGGDKQKLIEMFNDPKQKHLQPAILMADMQSQALKRNEEIKQGQGQGQPPTVAEALGLTSPPPPVLPVGLGAIAPQGGDMAAPQGMQMASAAPQGPVGMAAGGMTELPTSYGLDSLPIPDNMYDEQSFAGGGIVAFAKGSPGEVEADARARAKRQAEAYLGKPISDAEFDMLLRATHAEASAKSNPEEQAMIMGSMLNRARAKGKTIENVLYARNQFESVTGRKGARVPSDRFVQGPSEKRANAIFDATSLLPRVPLKQTDFTASNRNAYLPGTNVGYLDKLAEKGTQIAGHMFGMNIMPSDVQMARAEPPRSPLDVFTRPLGTTSTQAAPPIPRMAQPQTPQAQMPQFKVASAEPSGRAGFDFPIQLTQARVPQVQMPQFDVAAETPSASLPGKAGFDFPIQLVQARVPQAQMPQFDVASAPTRADQVLSALNAINPIGTARAGELPKPQGASASAGAGTRENYISPEEALLPRMGRAIGRGVKAVTGDIDAAIQNMAATELNQAAMGANIVPALVGGQLTPYRSPTTPPSMEREPKPFTGKPSLLPDGRPYAGPYNFKRKAGANAVVTPTAAPTPTPAAAPVAAKETPEDAISRILAAQKDKNFWSTMAQAGFLTASGKSQNAAENIGAGFAGALPGLAAANKSDQETALKLQELAQTRDYQKQVLDAQSNTDAKYSINAYLQQLQAEDQAKVAASNGKIKPTPLAILRGKAVQQYQEGRNPLAGLSSLGGISTALAKAQSNLFYAKQGGTPEDIAKAKKAVDNLLRAQETLSGVGSTDSAGDLGIQEYSSFFS